MMSIIRHLKYVNKNIMSCLRQKNITSLVILIISSYNSSFIMKRLLPCVFQSCLWWLNIVLQPAELSNTFIGYQVFFMTGLVKLCLYILQNRHDNHSLVHSPSLQRRRRLLRTCALHHFRLILHDYLSMTAQACYQTILAPTIKKQEGLTEVLLDFTTFTWKHKNNDFNVTFKTGKERKGFFARMNFAFLLKFRIKMAK